MKTSITTLVWLGACLLSAVRAVPRVALEDHDSVVADRDSSSHTVLKSRGNVRSGFSFLDDTEDAELYLGPERKVWVVFDEQHEPVSVRMASDMSYIWPQKVTLVLGGTTLDPPMNLRVDMIDAHTSNSALYTNGTIAVNGAEKNTYEDQPFIDPLRPNIGVRRKMYLLTKQTILRNAAILNHETGGGLAQEIWAEDPVIRLGGGPSGVPHNGGSVLIEKLLHEEGFFDAGYNLESSIIFDDFGGRGYLRQPREGDLTRAFDKCADYWEHVGNRRDRPGSLSEYSAAYIQSVTLTPPQTAFFAILDDFNVMHIDTVANADNLPLEVGGWVKGTD